jgi:hypothetical protein
MNKCESCYTCEKGVAKNVTREMFEEAKRKNDIPPDWIETATPCERCFTCQKCNTAQEGNCQNCFTCQKCYASQIP